MAQENGSINYLDYIYSEETDRMLNKFIEKLELAEPVFIWILSAVEIPVMVLTLFAFCLLIKSHRGASVFVIHLILSDLIQIICILLTTVDWAGTQDSAYLYCLIVGLYFMACVAFERYLLVSHPHWYKSHYSLKLSFFISLIIWFVPLIFANIRPRVLYFVRPYRSIACLIPYPIIILCFIGTCRGLSRSISLTPLKRKLIWGSLFLVLLTYTFVILPFVIYLFITDIIFQMSPLLDYKIYFFLKFLMYLNPLADCLLYLFMRTDVGDIMNSFDCCRRTDRHYNTASIPL